MGSHSSRLDSEQHLQAERHVAAPLLQDNDPFNSLYKSEPFVSAIPGTSSLYESSYGSFPSDLPVRPCKPSRFSFIKRKASVSRLASASAPAFSYSPPVSASESDLTFATKVEPQPYCSTDYVSTLPTPPASPLPSARPRRKPLPARNVSHDLRPAISTPTLSALENECHVNTSGNFFSLRTDVDLPLRRALRESRTRTVSGTAKSKTKSELHQDGDGEISGGVQIQPRPDLPSPISMDEDEWQDLIGARQRQQASNDVLPEDQAIAVPQRSPQGTKPVWNHPIPVEKKLRTSPRGSVKHISQSTEEDSVALSSDSELDQVETDSMYARRLDREYQEELAKSKSRQDQQQVHDAAIAWKLEQEQQDEERRQREEEESERLRVVEEEQERLRLEEEERERQRYRDCAVCGDSILRFDFPSLAYCIHEPETCAECYASWISSEIKDGSWRKIKCPGNKCKVVLENHEIQQFATIEDFEQ
jgi:hypothetical protein